jgi:hypothetical protein
VRCPSCQRFFCRECSTEHDGRLLCTECLRTLTVAAAGAKDRSGVRNVLSIAGWIAAALGGLLFAWMIFFYLGGVLARVPFDFHTGG